MQSVDATSSSETSYMMAGKTAARFLLDCMAAGGHVPAALRNSQRRSDADYVLSWLLKMATAAEKAVMQVQGPERDENAAHALRPSPARWRAWSGSASINVGRPANASSTAP